MTVSVIIPAYNNAAYLAEALHSVQSQTYSDLEIIVIDEWLNRRHIEYCVPKCGCGLARFCYHTTTQPNSGKPASARNVDLRMASGTFIEFLDGDDLYMPSKIECELAVLCAHPEADIVFCDVVQFQSDWKQPDNECYLRDLDFVRVAAQYLEKVSDDTYRCATDFLYSCRRILVANAHIVH